MGILLVIFALYPVLYITFGIPYQIGTLKNMIEAQDKELFILKIELQKANQKLVKLDKNLIKDTKINEDN